MNELKSASITIRLTEDERKRLPALADAEDRSLSSVARKSLEKGLPILEAELLVKLEKKDKQAGRQRRAA